MGKTLNNLANRLQSDAEKEFQNLENGLDDINKNGSNSPDPLYSAEYLCRLYPLGGYECGKPHHHAHGKPIFDGYGKRV